MLKPGDTFVNDGRAGLPSHLWIVLSDPALDRDRVVVVNVTTWRDYHDQTCILNIGDHSFIKHKSCVNYAEAKIAAASQLQNLIGAGSLSPRQPLTQALLDRILRGALGSDQIPIGCFELLSAQTGWQ